ncbi:MAG TPA: hypothetical protein VGS06_27060 [Streptosporangiaceae bacterium]|nr:hypothetical protein [Streptosporangiaceae bacterium]
MMPTFIFRASSRRVTRSCGHANTGSGGRDAGYATGLLAVPVAIAVALLVMALAGRSGIGGPPHLAVPAGTDGFVKDITTGKQRRGMDHQCPLPAVPGFNHHAELA